jgi:hypothetical protein
MKTTASSDPGCGQRDEDDSAISNFDGALVEK